MKDNQVFIKIMVQDETIPNHDFKQSGLERKERDSCGKSASKGDPSGLRRGSRTARGKECLEWKSTSENCNHTRGVEGVF
ncbi:hypothetical protein AM233_00380 [Bacillus sp. FJAT-22058]|nr:hypothetical protein AM233_00380 [Bacillus sp. FJAT-22058]